MRSRRILRRDTWAALSAVCNHEQCLGMTAFARRQRCANPSIACEREMRSLLVLHLILTQCLRRLETRPDRPTVCEQHVVPVRLTLWWLRIRHRELYAVRQTA